MQDVQRSANSETKSSAGDKYETGRSMAQLEHARLRKQYQIILEEKQILERLPSITSPKAGLGSLLDTSMGWIFLSVSLGIVKIEQIPVMVVSIQSPIGQAITGKKISEIFEFRGEKHQLKEMY